MLFLESRVTDIFEVLLSVEFVLVKFTFRSVCLLIGNFCKRKRKWQSWKQHAFPNFCAFMTQVCFSYIVCVYFRKKKRKEKKKKRKKKIYLTPVLKKIYRGFSENAEIRKSKAVDTRCNVHNCGNHNIYGAGHGCKRNLIG